MTKLYPLVFEPILKPTVWGGKRLGTLLGKATMTAGPIGESWELVDLPGAQSVVATGPMAGTQIGRLVQDYRDDLLGPVPTDGGRFPLLVKYIDAAQRLSVQVHPDELAAEQLGGRAKSEAWYIIDADRGAKLYLGLKAGTTAEAFRRAIAEGRVEQLLVTVDPHPGQLWPVRPGTIHAIGAGILLAEVQQPSDTTYRVYDWGRVGLDGQPRRLHIEEALLSTRCDARVQPLVDAYDARRFRLRVMRGDCDERAGEDGSGPLIVVGLAGTAALVDGRSGTEVVTRGKVVLVPHCCRPVRVKTQQDCTMLWVTFPMAAG